MDNNERPILSVIQDIKAGVIDPKGLDKEIRKQCVETMMLEGYSVPQIAQVLDRSEKTIKRDIALIREQNSLNPSIDLAKRLIGDLLLKAETHRTFLMRLARNRDSSVGEKAQAEYLAWKTHEEVTKLLQTMGYLPLKPKEVVADFVHHFEGSEEKSFQDLKEQIVEIEKISGEHGGLSEETNMQLKKLQERIEKAEIEYDINKIVKTEQKGDNNGTQS